MLFAPALAAAQPMGWGPAWRGPERYHAFPDRIPSRTRDSREGHVEASRFVVAGDAALALGQGPVIVRSEVESDAWADAKKRTIYEAAIENALVGAGYDTLNPGSGGHVASVRISRQVLAPAEEKRNPVSGTAAMEVGTRGSAYGLGINVDLSKPRRALVSTRLDARIVDAASGKVLWEGYVTIATRDGDSDWSDDRIASKLASALFDNFPKADPIEVAGA